jgi:hypothetical protein
LSALAEQISPDGFYRWDGVRWVPREGVIPAPVPAAPPAPPGTRLAAVGAGVAFLGAVVILIACALPYATYTDPSVSPTTPSIFNPGYPGALWYAVEPVTVALIGIVAGVLLIALRGRVARALAAAALLALGVQTVVLFVGYVGAAATGPSERAAIGGAIGLLGGLVLAIGGALAAASLSVRPGPAVPGS